MTKYVVTAPQTYKKNEDLIEERLVVTCIGIVKYSHRVNKCHVD